MKPTEATFVCTLCTKPVRSRFIPDVAPKCPSCGAATRPTEVAIKAEVHAFCSRCHYEGPAFVSRICPKCGSQFNGLPGNRPETARVNPSDYVKPVKQGPSGGVRTRKRKPAA